MKIHTSILTGLVLAAWAATAFAQDPTPISVETGTVEKEYLASRMPVSGVVISREDARIAAELAGRLTWIAEVGDQLQQGDVIARLESHLIELQRRDSEAAIKGLQANLAWVNRQTRRLEELATRNNTAHSELDEMRSRSIMLQQELIQVQLEGERIAYDLQRTEIRAPFAGVVVSRQISAGEYADVGQAMLRLVNSGAAEISVTAPLRLARFIQPGDPVTVSNEDAEGHAVVKNLIAVGDSRSHMMELRILPESDDWFIGEAVTVSLPASEKGARVTVARDALVLRDRGSFVYRVTATGTAEKVNVDLGPGLGERIAVDGDLRAGDEVVIRGAERLRDGQLVQRVGQALSMR